MAEDGLSVSLIAISFSNQKLGIACYEEISNTMYCDTIPASVDEMEETIVNLKQLLKPTLFLLHPNILSNKSLLELILSGVDGSPDAYRYRVLRSTAWKDNACQQLIHNCLVIRGKATGLSSVASGYNYLSSILDLEEEYSRQALGAMISYCQETVFKLDDGKVTVSGVKQIAQESYLRMDQASFRALHIFAEDIHPNVIKGKGRSKEGFSLFGLFDRTHSMPGRWRLRDWMLRPYFDKAKILQRQQGVALTARAANRDFVRAIVAQLRHFHDVPRLILRVKKVEATFAEWSKIHSSLVSSLKIMDHIHWFVQSATDAEDGAYISYLIRHIDAKAIHFVTQQLQGAIDFAQSEAEATIVFNLGYDESLDRLRHVYDHLETYMIQAAHKVLEIVPSLQNVSVEYIPQVGYLVAVNESDLPQLSSHAQDMHSRYAHGEGQYSHHGHGHAQDPPFAFVYQQAGVHYFKHAVVLDMDASIGDIKSQIVDRQRFLMLQIEDLLLDAEEQLQQLSILVSTLDALISLGALAVEQNLTRPELVDDCCILIKNGRHLLQELTVDNFVPNDTFLSGEKNIALITGPNTSGKSVYLKQVALIVYLAHIGSFVPCDKSRIGLTDRIMTRVTSTESVNAPLSAFALDLRQISQMLNASTKRSLCLIDEFGKGTNPVDGISLLAATIKHFARKGGLAMFVLHFTEILHDKILTPFDMEAISCFRMEMHTTTAAGAGADAGAGGGAGGGARAGTDASVDEHDSETGPKYWLEQTPLFKLKKGVASSSEGIPCAKSAGISDAILARARDVKARVSSRQPIQPHTSSMQSILQNQNYVQLLTAFLQTKQWIMPGETGEKQLHDFKKLL